MRIYRVYLSNWAYPNAHLLLADPSDPEPDSCWLRIMATTDNMQVRDLIDRYLTPLAEKQALLDAATGPIDREIATEQVELAREELARHLCAYHRRACAQGRRHCDCRGNALGWLYYEEGLPREVSA